MFGGLGQGVVDGRAPVGSSRWIRRHPLAAQYVSTGNNAFSQRLDVHARWVRDDGPERRFEPKTIVKRKRYVTRGEHLRPVGDSCLLTKYNVVKSRAAIGGF